MEKANTNNSSTKKTIILKRVEFKNISLSSEEEHEAKTLRGEKIVTIETVIKEKSKIVSRKKERATEPWFLPLVEISEVELANFRKSASVGFVLKMNGKLFYSAIPKSLNFLGSNMLGSHKCGDHCRRLSPASDERGGCQKVRDRNFEKRIERYPWITIGYQTFNSPHDAFVVVECSHYKKCEEHVERSLAEINRDRLSVAQFFFDDVETISDVRKKKQKASNTFCRN